MGHLCLRFLTLVRNRLIMPASMLRGCKRPRLVLALLSFLTLGGHGVQACLPPAWVHMMLASWWLPMRTRALAGWSIGGSQLHSRRRSSRPPRLTSARTAGLASSFGISCTTPLSTCLDVDLGSSELPRRGIVQV